MTRPTTAVFFGCWREAGLGHFLFMPDGARADYDDDERFGFNAAGPFRQIDGQLTPRTTTKQGAAALHHEHGWTALSCHDYTGDTRPGSNSTFIFDAVLPLDDALAEAERAFPTLIARIGPIEVAP